MRILWLSHIVPYPPKGGVLQRSYHLLRETALRHQVTLFTFVQKRPLIQCFGDLDSGLAESKLALEELCEDVRFFPINMESQWQGMARLAARSLFSKSSYTLNWLRSEGLSQVLEGLDESSFDLVHVDTISLAPFGNFFPNTPKVLDHHNVESQMMTRRASNESGFFRRAYYQQEARKILEEEAAYCPAFDSNIMCSELDAQRLNELVGSVRVDVIPNGVDLEHFKPAGKEEIAGRLVFAGRMAAYTNRQAALYIVEKIWPLLADIYPVVTFDLAGGSPLLPLMF